MNSQIMKNNVAFFVAVGCVFFMFYMNPPLALYPVAVVGNDFLIDYLIIDLEFLRPL